MHFVLVVAFGVMAYRIASAIRREAAIFTEFKQPMTLRWVVLLFPLGPLVLLTAATRFPFALAFVAAGCCYVPALLIARRQSRAFETAGTDRVKGAQAAISEAIGMGLAGLAYVAAVFVITLAGEVVAPRA